MKKFAVVFVLALIGAGVFVSTAAALRFETGDCYETAPGGTWKCPTGFSGAPYSAQLQGAGGCGPALPYQYTVLSGALPAGISLSSSGHFSGTPTTPGDYQFYVQISDENPPSQGWCIPKTSERQFLITILQGLTLNTASVPPATLGASYSTTLNATPAGVQTFSVTTGALPPGLTLGASNGVISGTPTTVGSYPFGVTVTDSEKRSARREYRIDVREPVTIGAIGIQGQPGGLPASEQGVSFDGKLTATGGTGTFTWTLAGGAPPTGLTLGPDGTITGTPATAGKFSFTAQVTDTEQRVATVNITLAVAAKLSIKTLALKAAKVGRAYNATLKTLGGVAPVKWEILRGKLPKGLHFGKKVGVFVGTPKREGTYRVTVQVVDKFGIKAQRALVLVVKA